MNASIFLAKMIGPMMLVMGLTVLVHSQRTRRMAKEFLESESLIFLSGVITLPVGLAIVITHNVWVANWPVIITLFGWIAVAAGVARMTLPGAMKVVGKQMIEKTTLIAIPGTVMVVLGLYLSYQGYFA